MQTESLISSHCEAHLNEGNRLQQDRDAAVASSSLNNSALQLPAKKPTRQWAAWTRQEEESFFAALRQVGKNFEKITCRVQSKNKDQVRHYYYRLVRRMNKLLGPELSLDAKNPKDTNAAMLRWWSLLEKYSCKASKLHLKPRRFKIFVEALEHQLLKDRKKSVKKRACQGESFLPTSCNISNQSRERVPDNSPVKLVGIDSQNFQKLGPGKGSVKRNVNASVHNSSNKGETTVVKGAKQPRKPAFRKWEKAAMAGVSLVADAAEHLERTAIDKNANGQGQKGGHYPLGKPPLHSPPTSQNLSTESNMLHSIKLKLQLFPIDDDTRRALEMDKHNPYLELTLSIRKKISSVLEHLVRKWGNSSAAAGELMLFPYSAQKENLVSYDRWTQDSFVSAADVHAMVGSPQVFRLRYGWFASSASESSLSHPPSSGFPTERDLNVENCKRQVLESLSTSKSWVMEQAEKRADPSNSLEASGKKNHNIESVISLQEPRVNLGATAVSADNTSREEKKNGEGTSARQSEDPDALHPNNDGALSAGAWADTLTNISVGDLLSEVPENTDADGIDTPFPGGSQFLHQTPFSCDSFDAAIAAHIQKHQNKAPGLQSTLVMHSSSIWDAEETCDAFSFQKNPVSEVPGSSIFASSGAFRQMEKANSGVSGGLIEDMNDAEGTVEGSDNGDPMEECPSDLDIMDESAKSYSALADLYWPESLGPLDLEIPSSKYHSDDIILSDSLGGLSRLLASSLDAFQSCSLLGFDKKPQASNG